MKTNRLTLCLILFGFSLTHSQPNYQWSAGVGGNGAEFVRDINIVADNSNNIISYGQFVGTADLDPTASVNYFTSGSVNYDGYILKLSTSGAFLWAAQLKGSGSSMIELGGIDTDSSGNIYVTGNFSGTVDFDPGTGITNLTSVANNDGFLIKLNSSGGLIWVKKFDASFYCHVSSVDADNLGNTLIGLSYYSGSGIGYIDADPGAASVVYGTSKIEGLIINLDYNGNYIWSGPFSSSDFSSVDAVKYDITGDFYVAGRFHGTMDIDPTIITNTITSGGNDDIFVVKLNPAGVLLMSASFGGSGDAEVNCLKLDSAQGNILLGGYFFNTVDFDPGPGVFNLTSVGGRDVYLVKLNATNGSFNWVKQFGGNFSDEIGSFALDQFDNCVIGLTSSSMNIDLDPGAGVTNLPGDVFGAAFFVMLNKAGDFQWGIQYSSYGLETANGVACDQAGNFLLSGRFSNTIDFDPGTTTSNLTSAGSDDIYIVKLGTITSINDNITFNNSIVAYPNPSQGKITIELGAPQEKITMEISNVLGEIVLREEFTSIQKINIELEGPERLYFIKLMDNVNRYAVIKAIKN